MYWLLGFKKEQLKVQLDNYGNLKVTGERVLFPNRISRFRRDFRVPDNSSTDEIRAKFEDGLLYVIIPKLDTSHIPIADNASSHSPKKRNEKEDKKQSNAAAAASLQNDERKDAGVGVGAGAAAGIVASNAAKLKNALKEEVSKIKEKIEQQRRHAQTQNGPKDQVPNLEGKSKESHGVANNNSNNGGSKNLNDINNLSTKRKEEGDVGNNETPSTKFKYALKDEVRKLKEKDRERRHGQNDTPNLEKYGIVEEQQNNDGLKKTATGKKTAGLRSSGAEDHKEEEEEEKKMEEKQKRQRTGRDWKSLKYGSGEHLGFRTTGKQGQLLVNVGVAVVVLVGLGIYASYRLN